MILKVRISIALSDADALLVGILTLVFMILFGFAACLILRRAATAVFGHENLIVTPAHFKIKRNLEFVPRQRVSVNNAAAAEEDLTCLDEMLCKQASGESRNLWKAEVRIFVEGFGK